MSTSVTIAVEAPLQDDVRVLIAKLNDHLLPLSPVQFQFKMTVEQMAEPDTTVFIARRDNGEAVGCGALKVHPDGTGEVKRMYTLEEMRGQKVGSAILQAIIALARHKGIERLVLETGEAPGFEGAYRLYERSGFSRCGAVLDYPDSGWSRFYEMRLGHTAAA